MSIIGFLFKPKKEMANPNTKYVRMGKYTITSHAQNRTVQPDKNLRKTDMVFNLFGCSKNSKIYTHKDGTKQYDRLNRKNQTITFITADKHRVKTIRKYHKSNEKKEIKKFNSR